MNHQAKTPQQLLHTELQRLQGVINYCTNYATAVLTRANAAKTELHKAKLLTEAQTWIDRAQAAHHQHAELKSRHFGADHPRFQNDTLQRKKAASAAWIAQHKQEPRNE